MMKSKEQDLDQLMYLKSLIAKLRQKFFETGSLETVVLDKPELFDHPMVGPNSNLSLKELKQLYRDLAEEYHVIHQKRIFV